MNCKRVRKLFSMRLDGELCFEEQRDFDDHLDRCPGCASEMRRMERTVAMVRDLPVEEASAGFVESVLARTRETSDAPLWPARVGLRERIGGFFEQFAWSWNPQVAVAAVALGIVVGGGLGLLVRPGEGPAATVGEGLEAAPAASATLQSGTGVASHPDETPVPGSLSDLVDQMMERMESSVPASDSTATASPDWGPSRDPYGTGRQVGAEPVVRRNGERGNRVYIVF